MMTQTSREYLLEQVKDFLCANYEKDGNDVLVECYTDAELLKHMGNSKTVRGAVRTIRKSTGNALYCEQRDAVRSEIF